MQVLFRCPKCGSNNTIVNPVFDDQSTCLTCEYNGYNEDSIYGKGFVPTEEEIYAEVKPENN